MDSQQQYADAMRAFDAYYGTRRRLMGADWPAKHYAAHRSWKAFLKVAELCDGQKADVERYVTVVLDHWPKNSAELVPNDLNGKTAKTVWDQHKNDRTITAKDRWAHCARLCIQMSLASGASDEGILRSAFNTQFPAWFRVFYPDDVLALCEKWGDDALEELKADRDLVRFLRAAMPAKVEAFEKKMGVIDGLQS